MHVPTYIRTSSVGLSFCFELLLSVPFCAILYLFIFFDHAMQHGFLTRGKTHGPLQWKHRVLTIGMPGMFLFVQFLVFVPLSHLTCGLRSDTVELKRI